MHGMGHFAILERDVMSELSLCCMETEEMTAKGFVLYEGE